MPRHTPQRPTPTQPTKKKHPSSLEERNRISGIPHSPHSQRGRHWLSTRKTHTRQGKAAGIRIQRRNSARLPSWSQVNWFCLPSAASSHPFHPETPAWSLRQQTRIPIDDNTHPATSPYHHSKGTLGTRLLLRTARSLCAPLLFVFAVQVKVFRGTRTVVVVVWCGWVGRCMGTHQADWIGFRRGSRNTRLHRTALPLPC